MSSRAKRKQHVDPLASDPNDEDWGGDSSPRPTKRRSKQNNKKRPRKRQRRGYGSDSDILDDEDDDQSSEVSFQDDSESEDSDRPLNKAGRSTRKAAQKKVKYEESDEELEDIEEAKSEDEDLSPSKRTVRSLIVTLKMPSSGSRNLRARSAGRTTKRSTTTPEVVGTRRSSRLSHDQEETLVGLSDSGKHVVTVRPGTRSPEPRTRRRSIGAKGMKNIPSAIMEASQEQSVAAEPGDDDTAADQVASPKSSAHSEHETKGHHENDIQMGEAVIEESVHEEDGEDSEDAGPVARSARASRARPPADATISARSSQRRRRGAMDESSDFEPAVEDEKEDDDGHSESDASKGKRSHQTSADEAVGTRRSRRLVGRQTRNSQRSRSAKSDDHDSDLDMSELAEEAEELASQNNRRRRTRRTANEDISFDQPKLRSRTSKVDYRILRPELVQNFEEEEQAPISTPVRNRRGGGGGGYRSLFSIQGPFGGAIGPTPIFGGPEGAAAGGADSDSSDDEVQRVPRSIGGAVGMTPTTGMPQNLFPQPHNSDAVQPGVAGGPANFGKVKDKKALADADPLGVDQNVSFEGVGGLDDHINQLKEMVMLPLLYPEVFTRFHVTPPRGVLFHGPPGTGKTLLARALASSVSSQGKKVTFYMRKGADALSKWVGEAERQLRLLFEEARKNQPSIIFFDEIDGLAPVRSSKQEQIHASIVATLLALMDGMDGRGQVIVIGATNRPDSVDPALRRPGRFDREFYFPLPSRQARRAIIDIHTKGWDPPLEPEFKEQLAELTKGYGGADLRALCTEAALNAVQGTFPQIYQSNKKLVIDPSAIKVLAKDFMISVNKIIPSSARSTSSGAAPLEKSIEPLLRDPFKRIGDIIDQILPQKKRLTALEEAQYDDRDDSHGFERENMQRYFERARVFRPRLLIHGLQGMGQNYIGSALLHKFENLHVQSFDLPTLLEDSARSPEAAVVQLFKEVRRHKPSVIYIPNVDVWYQTVGHNVIKTFTTLLRCLPPNEPVLVLGLQEQGSEDEKLDPLMLSDLFGYSTKNHFQLHRPDEASRKEYFAQLINYVRTKPSEFPDPEKRQKRKLPELQEAPEEKAPEGPSKEQIKAQRKQDRHTLNLLKIQLQPIMDQIRTKYKKFRTPIVDDSQIQYLYDEQNPDVLSTDLAHEQRQEQQMYRPYELSKDNKGTPGLVETATGKFYYNIESVTIEKRLSNGYYKRPKDFLADIKRMAKDARTHGDLERILKANELVSNVEVDIQMIEVNNPALVAECEAVWAREQQRAQEAEAKAKHTTAAGDVTVAHESKTTTDDTGPLMLGEPVPGHEHFVPVTPFPNSKRPRLEELSDGTNTGTGSANATHQGNSAPESNGDRDGDTTMTDSQELRSATHDHPDFHTPSKQNTQASQKQISARTVLQPNSYPQDLHNSASTTTSGQKTSDRSNRTSGPYNNGTPNTQGTNGLHVGRHPPGEEFSAMQPDFGGSQIPDTQGTTSHANSGLTSHSYNPELGFQPSQHTYSQQSQSSQGFVVPAPPRQPTSIPWILNSNEPPSLIVDENVLDTLHEQLVKGSSGLSVEQLEQVNSTLMDAIWKGRGEWNRNIVADSVTKAFNDVIKEIEEMQHVLQPSQKVLH